MILSDTAVKRPVLACVLSLLLVTFGIVSFVELPLREYPNIDPPIVTVEVDYRGAPASIVETRVTQLIEERVAGVEGIETIQSVSRDGDSRVTIEFSIERDIDAAANDIRDRVSSIQDNLPDEADPPEIQKSDSDNRVIIWQNLASEQLSVAELTDYADRYLVDQYSNLDGVARVRIGGAMRYVMRVWLDHQAMAAREITTQDIEQALRQENLEVPAGSMETGNQVIKLRIARQFNEPDDFGELVVKKGKDNYLVRLKDVARLELGVAEDRSFFRGNGVPMVGIGVIKQSNANTIDVTRGVKALTAKLNPNLPAGMSIEQSYDASIYIEAAISEVYKTLAIAIGCVVLVIFLFLGSARAMLVPAVTVPVSVIATSIVILGLGFSVNLLTLLALVLGIGLVVDDAIVVLENIVRRIKVYGETPLVAAYRGARQVGFAVVATTLVVIAVFIPITFLSGDIGRLFSEFSITLSAAVVFSSLVALTLSPMLASKVLSPTLAQQADNSWVDRGVNYLRQGYLSLLTVFFKIPWLLLLIFIALSTAIYFLFQEVPREFAPKEDRGAFYIFVSGPEGATHDHMNEYMTKIERRLMPYVEADEFKRLLVRTPRGFGSIESFNDGIVIVLLNDWSKRRPASVIMAEVRKTLADLPGVRAFPVMRQGLGGRTQKPLQLVLGGPDYETLAGWRDQLFTEIEADNPGFQGLDSDYKAERPQIDVLVDAERAADMGVTIAELGSTLETLLAGRRVTTYLEDGEEYDVVVQGDRAAYRSLEEFDTVYVRSARSDELIPLSNLVDYRYYGAADALPRYNRIRSVTVEANLAEGFTLGSALNYLENVLREKISEDVIIDYKGQSRELSSAGGSVLFVFLLGMMVVYLVLAAQFESFVHPFIIMFTVPLAIGGGLLGIWLGGGSLNIYSQIGLVMLIGLAAKNGILIVEYANQLRDEGVEFLQAIQQAAGTRFRPIVMTSLATLAGTLPLMMSSGAGSETRAEIGVVIFSGVLAATLFTLLFVPIAYHLLARGTQPPGAVAARLALESSAVGVR